MLRLFVDGPLAAGAELALPPGPTRHVQVRRLQPGEPVVVFDGRGGEWSATLLRIARDVVHLRVDAHLAADRELPLAVTLAVGMPANERMDILVEKATELGVAALQPLHTERSVLRLAGERAQRKREHWQALAVAASEQCGRTRVPLVAPVQDLTAWLRGLDGAGKAGERAARWLLSPAPEAPRPVRPQAGGRLIVLSGPEGGLAAGEEAAARDAGFEPCRLGPRILRAETAPLAVMAWLSLS